MSPKVVLVGLPGAGKTTVGGQLALALGVAFADSDDLVVSQTKRSVSDIFSKDGELTFRAIEESVIAKALLEFDGVLALGGGAITTAAVRQLLLTSDATVVLLTAAPAQLLERITAGSARPLLAGDAAVRLAELSVQRAGLYESVANYTVDTTDQDVSSVVGELSAALEESAA